MSKTVQMVFALGSISLVSGASLAGVFVFTAPIIQQRELEAKTETAKRVLPGAEFDINANATGDMNRLEGHDKNGNLAGVVYVVKGKGYGGPIDVVVGLSRDGRICGVRVGKNTETPGLGSRVNEVKWGEKEPWFTEQFKNVAVADLASGSFKLDAITGATISSKAVESAVRAAANRFSKETFCQKPDR